MEGKEAKRQQLRKKAVETQTVQPGFESGISFLAEKLSPTKPRLKLVVEIAFIF